jgi:hypothetical protein
MARRDEVIFQIAFGTAEDLARRQARTGVLVNEAAIHLGISERSFRSMVARKEVVPVGRFHGADVFDAEAIEKLRRERSRVDR